jgi:DNA-binding NarL/FixJ family response regulator
VDTESAAATPLRLLLVDGHVGFLQAALRTMSQESRIGEVKNAQSGREALALATAWAPDLVIMEITLPDGNGLEVGRSIKTAVGTARVVLMTVDKIEAYSQAALSAGLDGVIDKGDFGVQARGVVEKLYAAKLPDP